MNVSYNMIVNYTSWILGHQTLVKSLRMLTVQSKTRNIFLKWCNRPRKSASAWRWTIPGGFPHQLNCAAFFGEHLRAWGCWVVVDCGLRCSWSAAGTFSGGANLWKFVVSIWVLPGYLALMEWWKASGSAPKCHGIFDLQVLPPVLRVSLQFADLQPCANVKVTESDLGVCGTSLLYTISVSQSMHGFIQTPEHVWFRGQTITVDVPTEMLSSLRSCTSRHEKNSWKKYCHWWIKGRSKGKPTAFDPDPCSNWMFWGLIVAWLPGILVSASYIFTGFNHAAIFAQSLLCSCHPQPCMKEPPTSNRTWQNLNQPISANMLTTRIHEKMNP